MKKGLTITAIVVIVVVASIWAYIYNNPGMYIKYKCNQGGDSTRKFYDTNWQARGAVCDGYYIPFGSKLNGKDKRDVLAKMSELGTATPSKKDNMKALAAEAVNLI